MARRLDAQSLPGGIVHIANGQASYRHLSHEVTSMTALQGCLKFVIGYRHYAQMLWSYRLLHSAERVICTNHDKDPELGSGLPGVQPALHDDVM